MTKQNISKKARSIFKQLSQLHHDAQIELNYSNPFELLVATILSAQCTDVKVNQVTAKLFSKLKSPDDYIKIPTLDLEALIRPTGFFRNKAKSIKGAATAVVEHFAGQVPKTIDQLVTIPGVGRKTANVVLGNAFDIPGLPVDTHVTRIANRLGLTKNTDAVKIEAELCRLIPEQDWTLFSHVLIFHGRRICKARGPRCSECPITNLCNYFAKEHNNGKRKTDRSSSRGNQRRQLTRGN